ncbi:MAG TPA: LCP family protein [Nakamurella sp.]|nr:LCP family protein [Nakamurella sp.]
MSDEPRDTPSPATGQTEVPGQHRQHAHSATHGLLIAGRVAVALVAVVVLLVTGWEWSIKARADSGILSRSVNAIVSDDSNVSTATAAPAPAGGFQAENILLLGSDTRSGANGDASNSDSSTSDGVANSDTLMVAHISADRQHVTVLSIPRDTWIDAPTCKQWDANTGQLSDADYPVSRGDQWHVNWAYSVGGPQCTVRAVQDLTGLQIDRVIGIDFSGFKNMVDALGGITVDVCGPIVDRELQTVVAAGGVQTIGGEQALSLVRARNVIGDTDSDLARIRRQQIVLSSILQQVTSAGTLFNPSKLDAFLQAFVQNTFTDSVTIDDLGVLAQSFGTLDPSRVTFFTLPTTPSTSDDGALDVDQSKAPEIFDALINDRPLPGEPAASETPTTPGESTAATSASGEASGTGVTVDPATVKLTIVNATGQSGVATSAMNELNGYGFAVTVNDLQLADETAQAAATVEYAPENLDAALTVAAAVPGATLVPTDQLGSKVRLVLGESFDGPFSSVSAGVTVTGTVSPTSGAVSGSETPTLSSGELPAINAGDALCA